MRAIGGSGSGWGSAIHVESAVGAMLLPGRRCRVFVSYARVDEIHRSRLDVHLTPLVRDGLIDVWSDRAVVAGADWERDIQYELATADIVILLVTPDFVASAYCFERELPEILRRYEEGGLCVLPVHVKSVDMANLPIRRIQGLPADLRPVSAWQDADEAWLEVAQAVRRAADRIPRTRTDLPQPRGHAETRTRLGRELTPFRLEMTCPGKRASINTAAIDRIKPPYDVAERLGVSTDEESVVRRLNGYHADDEPVQLVTTYIRWSEAEGALPTEPKAGHGRLEDEGHVMTTGRDEITARMPTLDEAQFFQAPAGVPVLDVLHTSFDQAGEPFEVTRFVHRADRAGLVYTFDVES